MAATDAVRRRIDALMVSVDPLDREVGRRLASRLPSLGPPPPTALGAAPSAASRWRHVPLADVLEYAGNRVQLVGERVKSGHEPVHGSRSGMCLVTWPDAGRWWCSSCGRAGDVRGLVMGLLGMNGREAARWLADRYGEPADDGAGPGRRRRPSRRRPYDAAVYRVTLGEARRA